MSNEWDGKVVMSTPGGPIVTMSLGDLLARKDAEIERLRAALRECACACSSIRECESEWAKGDYCLHLNARKALEGKP